MKFITQIWKWILRWLKGFYKHYQEYSYTRVEDLPESLDVMKIYIVGESDFIWMAALKCPCGCGHEIKLNILKDASPCWEIKIVEKSISIYPSIWRTTGCKSHFNIRSGKVEWISNS